MGNDKLTITDVAERIGVTTKTIVRWEKSGKVNRPKRDWRGWRIYDKKTGKILLYLLPGTINAYIGNIQTL